MERGRPKSENGKMVSIGFARDDLERLREEAKEKRMSLSAYVRFLLFNDKSIAKLRQER